MSLVFRRIFLGFRARPFVSSCFALTLAFAVGNYFLWRHHATATARHAEALRNGEFMVHALNSRHKIDADLTALAAGFRHIDENLVDEHSMEVNLGYFYHYERMTRAHLVHLDQLAAPLPGPPARFKVVPFSMQLSGSYVSCMNFLRALENGPRLLRIRNCSFERSAEGSNDLLLTLTVDALSSL
jgi:hypothetical protein